MLSGDIAPMPLARRLLDVAQDAALNLRDVSDTDDDAWRPTEIAQPALFLVETVLAAELSRVGIEVVGVAGHSVGEYAALVAAGVLDAEDGMTLVVERGLLMSAMTDGTMVALLGAEAETVRAICDSVCLAGEGIVVVANINAPGQVVISGDSPGIAAASRRAHDDGVRRVIPLPVSGAFHSPLMAAAAKSFALRINEISLHDATVPVVSNVDGVATTNVNDIRSRLRRQMVSAVRWTDCVQTLVGLGAEVLVEVGPGAVLGGLAKRIAPGMSAISIGTVGDANNLNVLLEKAIA